MRRTSLYRFGIGFAAVSGLLTALYLMVRHEPDFYLRKEIPPSELRTRQSFECENKVPALVDAIRSEYDTWQATFTEAQINSYLQERFIQSGVARAMLPEGVSDPRISLEHDTIRLGFRYGTSPWSTVISVDFRIWQAPAEKNVVALQLIGLRAGSVPLTSKFLMHQLTAMVQSQNMDIDVSWHRHEGHLVALLRFNASRPRPTNVLDTLKVGQGKIVISGGSVTAQPKAGPAPTATPLPGDIVPPAPPVIIVPAAKHD